MKRSVCSVSPQLEDIPPDVWTEDKGAGPSSPADRLGVSRRPPLKQRPADSQTTNSCFKPN